jgi:hypothetical protein
VIIPKLQSLWRKVRVQSAEKLSSYGDELLLRLYKPKDETPTGALRTVVFVGEQLPPRIPRLSKYLRKNFGYKTILLCSVAGYVQAYAEDHFDRTELVRNEAHLKRMLLKYSGADLIHGFAPKSRMGYVAMKHSEKPYIHDLQDVLAVYYGIHPTLSWVAKDLVFEKACMSEADGIVAQSTEPNPAGRLYGIKHRAPRLYFPLLCDPETFQTNAHAADKPLSVVYAGGLAGSHRNPDTHGNVQLFRIIDILSASGIEFHVYPAPSLPEEDLREYRKTTQLNPLFTLHEPVAQSQLPGELSKYHFGILPFFKSYAKDLSALKYKYATTLKLFNFWEAGLPIIVSEDLGYQSWMVKRHKGGIVISEADMQQLGQRLKTTDYKALKDEVIRTREKYSLEKHTLRMHQFYTKLIVKQ